jgi:thiol-disulfide isomerase/thioredoxin
MSEIGSFCCDRDSSRGRVVAQGRISRHFWVWRAGRTFDGAVVDREYPGREEYTGLKRDQIVVVSFWASYCSPCRAEADQLNLSASEHRDVTFVGVNEDHTALAAARQYLADFKVPYASVHDTDDSIWVRWPVSPGLPVTYVIDRSGRIAAMITGGVTSAALSSVLARVSAD